MQQQMNIHPNQYIITLLQGIKMSKPLLKPETSKILSIVPSGKEFRFFLPDGFNTEVIANSLQDFANKLDGVDGHSILFHYLRGNFQKWVKDVLGDNQLADRLCFVEQNLSGETLRKELIKIVDKRINELKTTK